MSRTTGAGFREISDYRAMIVLVVSFAPYEDLNMRRFPLPSAGTLLAPMLALSLVALLSAAIRADNAPVAISASAETFAFTPDKIVAHAGVPLSIELTSAAGVHGIASDELGIPTTLIRPHRPVMVSFTPKTTGDVVVHCAFVCGIGHDGMAFTVHVEP